MAKKTPRHKLIIPHLVIWQQQTVYVFPLQWQHSQQQQVHILGSSSSIGSSLAGGFSINGAVSLISSIIKNYIKRLRPINDNSINNCIRVLIETRDYSFVSGHSTVSFTIAFLFYFIFNKTHKFSFIIFLFPLLFAYSRIYLAVHFPLDILFGMLLGYIVAFLIFKLINFVVLKK